VAPERVTVVLNVPDLALFAPRAAATPAEPGAPEGTFTLLYAGTLSSRHGLDLAIEAIDQLRDELPGLRLRIVGDGPERERLAALVAARGLSARVTLAGPRPLEAMPGELAACDAALSPHRAGAFGELTFPTKILEALAMGRPVVAARTAMVVRYLGEDLLYLFEPGSAAGLAAQIRRLCAGPAEAAARVARARQTLAQLSWQQQRLTLIRLMIGLCAGRPARGQTETTQ
jgi:glycosyltransferase involved in cell wall biosynthesis